jgi:hypothetical protein
MARMKSEQPGMIPLVTNDPHGIAVSPDPESYEFFERWGGKAPAWANQVTLKRFFLAMNILTV